MRFLILFCVLVLVVKSNAQINTGSCTNFQSEYIWIDSSKIKLTVFAYYNHAMLRAGTIFTDTSYLNLYYQQKRINYTVLLLKDSFYNFIYNHCLNIPNTMTLNKYEWSIYRYTSIIDFNSPALKDTLNKLNACDIDISYMGLYNTIQKNFPAHSGNVSFGSNQGDSLYCWLNVNRCFNYPKAFKSPKPRVFHPHIIDNWRQIGIQQIDFGYHIGDADSLSYQLIQPRFYLNVLSGHRPIPFVYPFSSKYYAESYCIASNNCIANPYSTPPRGFYLSPKTGVTLHYNKPKITPFTYSNVPIFTVECKSFKKDNKGQMTYISSQVRMLDGALPFSSDYNKNRPAVINGLNYFYTVCEEKADTISFNLTDTAAINQLQIDTPNYNFVNNVPGAQVLIIDSNSTQRRFKLAFTPPKDAYINSPYAFNIYCNEKLCTPDRHYVFRSAEFNIVPKPNFKIKIDSNQCGQIKFYAINQIQKNFNTQYQWLVYTRTDTVISSTKALDSIAVQKANWYYIKLNASNGYGCSTSFLDSVYVHAPAPVVSVNWPKKTLCFNEAFTINTSRKNAYAPAVINWFINHQAAGQADSLIVVGKDSLWIKAILSDNRQCKSADSAWVVAYKPYALKPMKDTALCFKSQLVLTALAANNNDTIIWLHNQQRLAKATIASAAQYHIQYIDSNACSVIDTFTVAQLPALLEPLKDSSLCPGAILNINPIKLSGINYQPCIWQYKQQSIPKDSVSLLINSDQVLTRLVSANIGSSVCSQFDTAHMTTLKSNTICVIALSDSCLNRHKAFVHFENHQPTSPQINWGDMSFALSDSTHHLYQQSGDYKILATFINEQQCPDSSTKALHIAPSPAITAWLNDSAQCLNNNLFSLNLNCNPNNLQHIDWGDNNTQNSLNGTVQHQYQSDAKSISISSKLLGCTDTVRLPITLYPAPVAQLLSKGQCTQDSIAFWINQSNVRLTQTDWWINNQNIAQDSLTYYVFNQPGNYTIECRIASSNNCYDTLRKALRIVQKPKAAFSFAQKDLGSSGLEYKFINQSQWFNACLWQINKDTSTSIQLSKLFTDTGWMRVVLTVSNQGVCFDSAAQMVPVFRRLKFYFPNACSPNANNLNDGFGLHPEQANWVKQWQLSVFNRWGECLFKSDNPYELFVPNNLPLGIYIYLVELKDILNNTQTYKGSFEVIR